MCFVLATLKVKVVHLVMYVPCHNSIKISWIVTGYKFGKSNKYLSTLESFKVVNLMMYVLFWLC